MAKRTTYTIHAKGKALEVIPSSKDNNDRNTGKVMSRDGRVSLKFFEYVADDKRPDYGKKTKELYFVMDVVETNFLGYKIQEMIAKGGPKYSTNPHKYTPAGGTETISTVSIEKWGDEKRSGFAIQLFRGQDRINVAMDEPHFLYLGTLLRHMSMEQSYNEYLGGQQAEAAGRQAYG